MIGLKIAASGLLIFAICMALSTRDAFGEDTTPLPIAVAGVSGFTLMVGGLLVWIWGLA